jgi:hypothetical protein
MKSSESANIGHSGAHSNSQTKSNTLFSEEVRITNFFFFLSFLSFSFFFKLPLFWNSQFSCKTILKDFKALFLIFFEINWITRTGIFGGLLGVAAVYTHARTRMEEERKTERVSCMKGRASMKAQNGIRTGTTGGGRELAWEREKRLYLEYQARLFLLGAHVRFILKSASRAEAEQREDERELETGGLRDMCSAPPSIVSPIVLRRHRGIYNNDEVKAKRRRDPGSWIYMSGRGTSNILRPFESIGEANTIHCCAVCICMWICTV